MSDSWPGVYICMSFWYMGNIAAKTKTLQFIAMATGVKTWFAFCLYLSILLKLAYLLAKSHGLLIYIHVLTP